MDYGGAAPDEAVADAQQGDGPEPAELHDAEPQSVDSFLPETWVPHDVERLDRWTQGMLLPGLSFSWATPVGADSVLGAEETGLAWDVLSESPREDLWAAVVSQTCDVEATGPGERHPFVNVCPVVNVDHFGGDKKAAIERFETTYLVKLTQPPAAGFWVADLRVLLPVSKALLVENEPVHGFANEDDRFYFAEAIANRFRRPALHDALSYDLLRDLDTYVKQGPKKQPEWWQKVEQVRLQVHGDRLHPAKVNLIVCHALGFDLTQDERTLWRNWTKRGKTLLDPHGIHLDPTLFTSLQEMRAETYITSVPLQIPSLGRRPTW